MRPRLTLRGVYAISALLHGGLWFGVRSVEAPPPPRPQPMRITIRDVPPPPPEPEPEPAPEAKPEPEALEAAAPEVPAPPEPAPAKPRRSKPETAPSEPAPTPAGDAPEFGVELGGGVGPGGLSVPAGDPGGGGGSAPAPKRRVEGKARKLDAPAPKPAGGCEEKEVKPKPLELPQPKYTDAARAAGVEGAVRVQLAISAEGEVTAVKVLQSLHPELDAAAERAVQSASFAPATRCGLAVATTITISIKFSL